MNRIAEFRRLHAHVDEAFEDLERELAEAHAYGPQARHALAQLVRAARRSARRGDAGWFLRCWHQVDQIFVRLDGLRIEASGRGCRAPVGTRDTRSRLTRLALERARAAPDFDEFALPDATLEMLDRLRMLARRGRKTHSNVRQARSSVARLVLEARARRGDVHWFRLNWLAKPRALCTQVVALFELLAREARELRGERKSDPALRKRRGRLAKLMREARSRARAGDADWFRSCSELNSMTCEAHERRCARLEGWVISGVRAQLSQERAAAAGAAKRHEDAAPKWARVLRGEQGLVNERHARRIKNGR